MQGKNSEQFVFIDLLKKISLSKDLNPFNPSFSINKFQDFIQENFDNINMDFMNFILLNNQQFQKFLEYVDKLVSDKDNSYYYLLGISFANHDWIELNKETKKQLEKIYKENNKVHTSLDYQRVKISTCVSDFSLGAFSDAITDSLDFLFSVLKRIKSIPVSDPLLDENLRLNSANFYTLQSLSGEFIVLKGYFEQVCLGGENFKQDNNKLILSENPTIQDLQLYRQIGLERIQQNINMIAQEFGVPDFLSEFRGRKEIDKVLFGKSDEIIVTFRNKKQNDPLLVAPYMVVLSTIYNYHGYLTESFLCKIRKIGEVYSVLVYLVFVFIEQNSLSFSEEKYSNGLIPFSKYQFKISEKTLISLIHNITEYKHDEILDLLKVFINYGASSFWDKPLLKIDQYYFIGIHSLISVSTPYLIDTWLKEEFNNFDMKGKLFEKFLKDEISRLCEKKNFFSKIIHQQNFSIINTKDKSKKIKEEIDFIWETKNTIIIAEVKCMNYPFTKVINYNNLKTLEKASEQIIRKTNFLLNNKTAFPDINLNKKVLSCIITNYPIFSGIKINNIPVLDIGLFVNYIDVGGIGNKVVSKFCSRVFMKKTYYNNEDEFSDNLEILISKSQYIEQLKRHYKKVSHSINIFEDKTIVYDTYENEQY